MVTFLSLFLNLIVGTHPVNLSVESGVASIELRLNGDVVGRAHGEPWTVSCDFGTALKPHELVVVAFDAEGNPMGRARQVVNLPREQAEARLALSGGQPGAPTQAQLTWDSVIPMRPKEVHLSFDGRRLPTRDFDSIRLPAYDPEEVHFLTAELLFPGDLEVQTTVSFGGSLGQVIDTELTAVPIVAMGKDEEPPAKESMTTWFESQGRTLEVFAVEENPADIVLVVGQEAWLSLKRLGERRQGGFHDEIRQNRGRGLPRGLRRGDRLRFIATHPAVGKGSRDATVLFPFGIDLAKNKRMGVPSALLSRTIISDGPPQRLADAVAAAGLGVATSNRPRVVILVVGRGGRDASQFEPLTVRSYLRQIGVPLVVWTTYEPLGETAWGPSQSVSHRREMEQAVRTLRDQLDRQHVVWLKGQHLPQNIELKAEGWSLAR